MKKMTIGKRLLAMLLVVAMVLSMAACGAPQKQEEQTQLPPVSNEEALSRGDMELIVELLGNGEDPSELTDEELKALVDRLVGDQNPAELVQLGNQEQEKVPTLDTENHQDAYDENGAMTKPFDQVYPEVIEKEEVTFSGESILVKLASDTLTDGLKAAGVGALKEIVPMDGCAWYEAMLTEGTEAGTALESVRELKEVLLAEYNYEVKTAALDDYKHFDDKTDKEFQKNGHNKDQWHQHYCGIPGGYEEMETEGGDPSVIVAVIDSGVDYDHEDLKDNMWFNAKEIPDNGIDDDKNGYIDDYYGVDLIAGKGSADDDNGHGTHVAGIIAGRNNNTGIVGIAYNVKIMSVKAAMHNGTLNQADIAEAILYAYEMGAEVINMSFGGTASSIAVQDALATAYNRCVLVASAGNSGKPNEKSDHMQALPNYPAALSYVLGVMSVDENGVESSFSNWDIKAFNGVEYEVYAPGENIMSTLPNDQYGFLSGTSMAAPIVSSFAAILRSEFTDRDKYPTKFIYGQLASTSEYYATCIDPEAHAVDGMPHNLPQIVNLEAALTKLPKPEVNVNDHAIFDSTDLSSKNNGDGVIDAGETIALGLTLRNRWGMSENTLVTVDTLVNGIEDPYITIQNPTVNYGSVGTYSEGDCGKIYTDGLQTGWENPFIIKIADNCPNDYRFTLNITVTCENALDEADETVYTASGAIDSTVRSGTVLPSVIEEDMVLTADSLYIIPNATVIQPGVTVRVEPGTHIQFWSDDPADPYASNYIAYLLVNGNFLVEGTKENPVYIYPSQLMDHYGVEIGAGSTGYVSMKYADITNFFYGGADHTGNGNTVSLADHCTFRMNYGKNLRYRSLSGGSVQDSYVYSNYIGHLNAKDCVFYKLGYESNKPTLYGTQDRCIFVDCGITLYSSSQQKNCVFLGNSYVDQTRANSTHYATAKAVSAGHKIPDVSNTSIFYNEESGTTYIRLNSSSSTITPELAKQVGVSYFVPETPEELDWVVDQVFVGSTYISVGIYHNGETFVWSDGSKIPAFADPEGLAEKISRGKELYFHSRFMKLVAATGSAIYRIYEIPGEVYPWTVEFAETDVTLDLRTTYQLEPASIPVQPERDEYIYQSTDKSVVTVTEDGLVTPVGIGDADVIVYAPDKGVYNHVTFHILPREIHLQETETTLYYRDTYQIAPPVAYPIHQENESFVYTSSDEKVVTVTETGFVTATGAGTATITVAAADGLAENTITVTVLPRTVSVKAGSVVVNHRDTYTLLPTILPTQYADDAFTYASDNEAVVTVDEAGVVTAVATGTATVTVSAGDHTTEATVTFTVLPRTITVNSSEVEILHVDTWQILPGVDPTMYPDDTFTYESSDEAVVTVDENGLISGVAPGEAVVTVFGGEHTVSAEIAVTVLEFYFLQELSFTETEIDQATGTTYQTELTLNPTNATTRDLTYASDNEAVAIVNETGMITVVGSGVANITATCQGKTASVQVTGYKMATSVKINVDSYRIRIGLEYQTMELPGVIVSEGGEPKLVWSTADTSVAKVVDGKVQLLKTGATALKVTDTRSGKYDTVTLEVFATCPDISGTGPIIYALEDQVVELPSVTLAPGAETEPQWYVSDSDSEYAEVVDGKLCLHKATPTTGKQYFYLYVKDPRNGQSDSITVRITATAPKFVETGALTVGLEYGTVELPEVILAPGAEAEVQWSVSDETYAKVEDGKLHLYKQTPTYGYTYIYLYAKDPRNGLSASKRLNITLTRPSVNMDGWGDREPISGTVLLNFEQGSYDLPEVTLAPGMEAEPVWKISEYHTDVAQIEDGKLIILKTGYLTLYVTDPRTNAQESIYPRIVKTAPVFEEPVRAYTLDQGTVELPALHFAEGVAFTPVWEVQGSDVVELQDGKLLLKKTGVASVKVTDPRNGLSCEHRIAVSGEAVPKVVDLFTFYRYPYGYSNTAEQRTYYLDENGTLYDAYYNNTVVMEDVKQIAAGDDGYGNFYTMILKTDGTILTENSYRGNDPAEMTYFINNGYADQIVKIETAVQKYLDDPSVTEEDPRLSCYVLLEDGNLYSFGTGNRYGQLADGTLSAGDYRWNANWIYYAYDGDKVKDVKAGATITYFLEEDGNLSYAGGEEAQATGMNNVWDPHSSDWVEIKKLHVIIPGTENVLVEKADGRLAIINGPTGEILSEGGSMTEFEEYVIAPSYKHGDEWCFEFTGLYNGRILQSSFYDYDLGVDYPNVCPNIAVEKFNADYAITPEGVVYSLDYDYIRHIPVISVEGMSVEIVSTNLPEDNILREDALRLETDITVDSCSISSYADGSWVWLTQTIENGNVCKLVPENGWQEGVTYKITVNNISNSTWRINLAEKAVYEFTWQPAETETAEPVMMTATRMLSGAQETFPALSADHTTVVNTEVQRYHTSESFVKTLTDVQKQMQYNETFWDNVVLNPVTTDTEVTHWFRPQAPSVSSGAYTEVSLGGNYWGTTDTRAIELQMIDYTDFISYARLMYAPYLTEAPENTFPFVTSVKLFNKAGEEVTTVGNEAITFRVTFNRDMDTSIPLQVRYGAAYPYGDYEVAGSYVDARTWEGTYTLNTVIENGNQFITIANGCSATEDLELQTDVARFGFVIDTTAAQALTMQGTATDTGVELRWTQDDFDTLMGYNVYRSDKEDGLYTRVNKTVIPANTMTFFDDTVEPGKIYYYNFTVVKTDLTESEPSGKISIMSKDTMAPNIYHSPVSSAFTGSNLVLSATVTDNLNIAYANLYYRVAGTEVWNTVRMNNLNSKYSAIIPAAYVTTSGVEYYIEAFDGVSYTYKGSADAPYLVAVQESVDANALGDVDGDGAITNLDALLLLYAINDKYNLTTEEFARADLNGDGELWAAEALRILQYVSGTVGSVKM